MMLIDRDYSDEELLDLEEHVFYEIEKSGLPTDDNGFTKGHFRITMEFVPE